MRLQSQAGVKDRQGIANEEVQGDGKIKDGESESGSGSESDSGSESGSNIEEEGQSQSQSVSETGSSYGKPLSAIPEEETERSDDSDASSMDRSVYDGDVSENVQEGEGYEADVEARDGEEHEKK